MRVTRSANDILSRMRRHFRLFMRLRANTSGEAGIWTSSSAAAIRSSRAYIYGS